MMRLVLTAVCVGVAAGVAVMIVLAHVLTITVLAPPPHVHPPVSESCYGPFVNYGC